eukprot:jgi/Botrbrau1/2312/Bobra.39_1s0001.1
MRACTASCLRPCFIHVLWGAVRSTLYRMYLSLRKPRHCWRWQQRRRPACWRPSSRPSRSFWTTCLFWQAWGRGDGKGGKPGRKGDPHDGAASGAIATLKGLGGGAPHEAASSWETLEGLVALNDIQAPPHLHLLPSAFRQQMPGRILAMVRGAEGSSNPQQQRLARTALSLAVRLGVSAPDLLSVLLESRRGVSFFEAFRPVIHPWLLWHAGEVAGTLCGAAGGNQGLKVQPVAIRVLCGTLEALLLAQQSSPFGDVRSRSFIAALLPHLYRLGALAEAEKTLGRVEKEEGSAATGQATGKEEAASLINGQLTFLQISGQVLELDAPDVLAPHSPALNFLLGAYLSILGTRGSATSALRAEALGQLPAWLGAEPAVAGPVVGALGALVDDTFPAASWELPRGSSQAADYLRQLLAAFDGIAEAANRGADVGRALQALMPVLREMGDPRGHVRQAALIARLSLIASSPWRAERRPGLGTNQVTHHGARGPPATPSTALGVHAATLPKQEPLSPTTPPSRPGVTLSAAAGGGGFSSPNQAPRKARAEQARALFRFAWDTVFETSPGADPPPEVRKAVLLYLLLKLLRAAPLSFQLEVLREKVPQLLAICSSGTPSPTLGGEASNLAKREAAFLIWDHVYRHVPPDDIKTQLFRGGGSNPEVMKRALEGIRGSGATKQGNATWARGVRCAAFAAATSLVAATQHKLSFFELPLKSPEGEPPAFGPWRQLLDWRKELHFSEEVQGRGALSRAADDVHRLTERLRAERRARAGVSTASIAFGGTLGSLAFSSLDDKLSSSQLSLGGASMVVEEKESHGRQASIATAVFQASLDFNTNGGDEEGDPNQEGDLDEGTPDDVDDDLPTNDDELDRHPVMLPLVRLVERAADVEPPPAQGGEMPGWMRRLHDAVSSEDVPNYVRQFLVRMILHVDKRAASGATGAASAAAGTEPSLSPDQMKPSVFACFGNQWLPAIVGAMIGDAPPAGRQPLHYFLLDVSVMLLSWQRHRLVDASSIPAATDLLSHLVRAAYADSNRLIKNNFALVKAYLGTWKGVVPLRARDLLFHLCAPPPTFASRTPGAGHQPTEPDAAARAAALRQRAFGMKLLAAALMYGYARQLMSIPKETELLVNRTIGCINAKPGSVAISQQGGETTGVLLHQLAKLEAGGSTDGLEVSLAEVRDKARLKIVALAEEGSSAQIWFAAALERLAHFYPPALDPVRDKVVAILPRVAPTGGTASLLLTALKVRARELPGLLDDLLPILDAILGSHNAAVLTSALELLAHLLAGPSVPDLKAGEVLHAVTQRFAELQQSNRVRSSRAALFTLLRDAWQTRPALHARLRPPLLWFLADPDPSLRGEALHFWDTVLPKRFDDRLRQFLADGLEAAGPWEEALQQSWSRAAAMLLLTAARSGTTMEKPLFQNELGECRYIPYQIDTTAAATFDMAPLFSSRWESQDATQGSEGARGTASSLPSQAPGGTQVPAGFVRATMAATMANSISLNLGYPNEAAVPRSRAPGAPSISDTLAPTATIQRRMTRYGDRTRIIAAQARKAVREAAAMRISPQKVTLLRQYRRGELPDIRQITVASFFGPLGLLLQQDQDLPQLLVEAFAKASIAQANSSNPEGGAAEGGKGPRGGPQELREALQLAFERRPTAENFVRALQRIALADRGVWVDAGSLSEAALAGCVPGGLLQMEQQLIFGEPEQQQEDGRGSRKRRRVNEPASGGTGRYTIMPHPHASEEDWAVLADLYSNMGLTHLSNLTYSTHVARCPGTKAALEDLGSRSILNAFARFEGLMRAVAPVGTATPMEMEGGGEEEENPLLTPTALLGSQEPQPAEERLWFVERSRCLEEMGDWASLLDVLDEELADVGERSRLPRHQQDGSPARDAALLFEINPECDWEGPKLLRQYVRACLFQPTQRRRLADFLGQCNADVSRMSVLHLRVPAELALNEAASRKWTTSMAEVAEGWKAFRKAWAGLHPLNAARRYEALCILQPLAEVQEVLQLMQAGAVPDPAAMEAMGARWRHRWPARHVPAASPTLTVACGREALLDGLAVVTRNRSASLQKVVQAMRSGVRLGAATALEGQGFVDAAAELLNLHTPTDDSEMLPAAEARLRIALAQLAAYCGAERAPQQVEAEVQDRLERVQELTRTQGRGPGSGAANQEARMGLLLQGDAMRALSKGDPSQLEAARNLYQEAVREVDAGSCAAAVGGSAALRIAQLCDERLAGNTEEHGSGAELAACLVGALLTSLHLRSTPEAELYIPRALLLLGLPKARRAWEEKWGRAPVHVFLAWAAQMLSLMATPESDALIPCLEELARQYRQQLYFLYHTSRRSWPVETLERTAALGSLLEDLSMAAFGSALNDLTFPVQRWEAWFTALSGLMHSKNYSTAIALYREEVRPDMIGRHLAAAAARGRGSQETTVNAAVAQRVARKFDDAFGPGGEKLRGMTLKAFTSEGRLLQQALRDKTPNLRGKRDVASLSPWLAQYSDKTESLVALPYMGAVGTGPPPDVRVIGFGATVDVFASKQQPKKLQMYGDDFRTYEWVVKGGEDVRVDQRVEQLFGACNGRLDSHPGASSYNLRVPTYDVVAVGQSLGLVQFVASTVPLKALILKPSLITEQELALGDEAYQKAMWVNSGGNPRAPPSHWNVGVDTYNACFAKAKRADVVAAFQEAESCVRWDALREGLLRISGGPEEFLDMRGRYSATLAATCVTGYIAGCGDRHMDNFLLHSSGSLIPIDFGYSFGTGTQALPIPELVPFRLTRQLVGVFQPHDATAALQAPLAQGLAALHASRHIIEGITAIFLREPILEWQKEARALQDVGSRGRVPAQVDSAASSENTHISLKVGITQEKLEGRHPSDIMRAELVSKHGGKPWWSGLQAVVQGDSAHNARARFDGGPSASLTPEQQAACLLDQATDANVLGRMYSGWRPWL